MSFILFEYKDNTTFNHFWQQKSIIRCLQFATIGSTIELYILILTNINLPCLIFDQ